MKRAKFEVVNHSRHRVSSVRLRKALEWMSQALVAMDLSGRRFPTEVAVVIVDSVTMKELNRKYRKKNYPTDVLSFSFGTEPEAGELVLCWDVCLQQAGQHRHTVLEEAAYLLLHGYLHLAGYNHEHGGRQARQMYEVQDGIFGRWRRETKKKNKLVDK